MVINLDPELTAAPSELGRRQGVAPEVLALNDLRERFPADADRAFFTLGAFAGESGDIDEPFEQGHEVFDVCRDEIGRLIPRVADRLLGHD